ncbi:hypothetical protein [Streptomyces sp. NPDC014685]|uniref:hypothetical protein n=1 Tax=Streptomyces sp. NPDC014685 TaxID=3364881 RepID=UPI0036FC2FAE
MSFKIEKEAVRAACSSARRRQAGTASAGRYSAVREIAVALVMGSCCEMRGLQG